MEFPIQNVNRAHLGLFTFNFLQSALYTPQFLFVLWRLQGNNSVSQQIDFHPGEQTRVKALVTVRSQQASGQARNQSVSVACKLPSCTATQTTPSPIAQSPGVRTGEASVNPSHSFPNPSCTAGSQGTHTLNSFRSAQRLTLTILFSYLPEFI